MLLRREFKPLEVGIAIGADDRRNQRVAVIHLELDSIRPRLKGEVGEPEGGIEISLVVAADLGDEPGAVWP